MRPAAMSDVVRAHGLTWGVMGQPDWAGSGEMVAGMVVERDDRWVWQTQGLAARHVGFATHGEVETREAAMRAVEDAWRSLLDVYALEPRKAQDGVP